MKIAYFKFVVVTIIFLALIPCTFCFADTNVSVPSPTTELPVSGHVIIDPEEFSLKYPPLFFELKKVLDTNAGPGVEVSIGTTRQLKNIPEVFEKYLGESEAFFIQFTPGAIKVFGVDDRGVLYGIDRLINLLNSEIGFKPNEIIVEKPSHSLRGLHFVLRWITLQEAKKLVVLARKARMNFLVVQLADAVQLESMRGMFRSDALTRDELKQLVYYADQNGLQVIPEVKLLTHQEKFLGNSYPHLMFNGRTYDPRNKKVYEIVSSVLDEIIDLIEPKALHIGHDEVIGWNARHLRNTLGEHARQLPPELFLEDVKWINRFLQDRGIDVWMWGDMLLNEDLGAGKDKAYFHGRNGYSELLPRIPKNITILDWHYESTNVSFPSFDEFEKYGFNVIGSTWKDRVTTNNFSRYTLKRKSSLGMLATTWFYVQRRDWQTVEYIIEQSGKAFWGGK